MDGDENGRDDAERRCRRVSDATCKQGSRRWLKYGLRPPLAFECHELEEYEHELASRCIGSPDSFAAGSSSMGASSSRTITPVKRRAEELGPLAFKLKDDTGELCGGVIGPEDYLLPGQEDHLMRAIMERSVREAAEDATHNLRKLDIEQIFLEQGVTASQASTSKEADLCVLKAEQDKIWIDLDSTSDKD